MRLIVDEIFSTLFDMTPSAPLPSDTTTLTSSVYQQLRRDILKAHLIPGEKLRIESLSARYQVGASPIREALNRLSAEGLVTREEQRGFRVLSVSRKDLQELTDTRCWINELALRQSIQRGDAAWEERVLLAYHRLSRAPVYLSGGVEISPDWEQRHREFHGSLIAACGSRWLFDFSAMLFDFADRYRHLSAAKDGSRNFEDEHRSMMEATIARDFDRAIQLLNVHITRTSEIVLLTDEVKQPKQIA